MTGINPLFRSLLLGSALTGIPHCWAATTGTISGQVTGEGGAKLSKARVFVAVPSTTTKIKAPPTTFSKVADSTLANGDGKFSFSNLPAGTYVLCAQTTDAGWLDPCHWSATVPVITLAAGQSVSGVTVTMPKGAVINVHLTDQTGQLIKTTGRSPQHDVDVKVRGSNNHNYNLPVTVSNGQGRDYSITVPFSLAHTVTISSSQFTLADPSHATSSAVNGVTQAVQIPSGTPALQLTFFVTGKTTAATGK